MYFHDVISIVRNGKKKSETYFEESHYEVLLNSWIRSFWKKKRCLKQKNGEEDGKVSKVTLQMGMPTPGK